MNERARGRFFEFLGAGVAGLVSILALGVSAYSTYWQRQQTRAVVLPRLQFSVTNDNGKLKLTLENVGVGPADIRAAEMKLDGVPIESWGDLLLRSKTYEKGASIVISNSSVAGRLVAAGREERIFELDDLEAAKRLATTLAAQRFEIGICYCSVLDECWHLRDGKAFSTQPVDSCAGLPNTFKN